MALRMRVTFQEGQATIILTQMRRWIRHCRERQFHCNSAITVCNVIVRCFTNFAAWLQVSCSGAASVQVDSTVSIPAMPRKILECAG